MSVYYYEPFYNFDRFFDEALSRSGHNQQGSGNNNHSLVTSFKPKMDLHENDEKNIVTASFELPGMKKEDVNIDIRDGRLTVSGETKISEEHEKDGYAVRERRFGKFSRTLQLPRGVKEEEIKASFNNGILTVIFPKTGKEAEPRKVTIA
ncbi:HSP20-like chaperone [Marasmius fiardii PR-910]|nr:HSP20-like chaperone [Marasmius fiardii PR-910]